MIFHVEVVFEGDDLPSKAVVRDAVGESDLLRFVKLRGRLDAIFRVECVTISQAWRKAETVYGDSKDAVGMNADLRFVEAELTEVRS